MPGYIIAIIGSESHTSSKAWANVAINGQAKSHRDAHTKKWVTEYGDNHATWVECSFQVEPGDIISVDAGANHGRGGQRPRVNRQYRFDPHAAVVEIELPGVHRHNPKLEGRLILIKDAQVDAAKGHEEARKNL